MTKEQIERRVEFQMDATLAKVRARKAQAAALAEPGKPVRFIYPTRQQRGLAQFDMCGDDVARLTTFDDLGPSGHLCFGSLTDAIDEALKWGGIPQ